MKRRHGILIIGAGKIGTLRANVIRKLNSNSKIYIFDVQPRKSKELAENVGGIQLKSIDEGLKNKNIDIVIVSVINKYAKEICIRAIKNNKHVLCEKPMGINYKEALEIYNTAKRYKKKIKCGFNHRYHPAIKEAHKLCKQGKIGKILFIRGVYGHGGRKGYEKEWRAKKPLSGGGQLLDQGSHLVDLSLWFLGFEEIKKAFCIAKPMFWKMKVDDNAFVILETKSGKVVNLHTSWTQWKNKFQFEVYGTKGAVEVIGLGKSYGTEILRIYKRSKLGGIPRIFKKQFKGYDKSWELEWMDFIRSIKSKKPIMSNAIENLKVMKTISRLYSH